MQQAQTSSPSETFDVLSGLCREFSIDEILAATENFNNSFVIGQGGFALVYKGMIENGTRTVAIKKLKSMTQGHCRDFRYEVKMVSKLRHVHLVSLLGYCETSDNLIFVYEYMDGGTLEDNLCKVAAGVPLHWVERLKISIGVASALYYLHTCTSIDNKIIHRDIKSTNILLDKSLTTAKISDFGLSTVCPANQLDTQVFTRVMGTPGYVDPAYFNTSLLSSKTDVYAFGIVLFQLLCGRKAVDMTLDKDQHNLAEWAKLCVSERKTNQIIDPHLRSEILKPASLSTFVNIAHRCLNEHPNERPTMLVVLGELDRALLLQESTTVKHAGTIVGKTLRCFTAGASRQIISDNGSKKLYWLDDSGVKCYMFPAKYLSIEHSDKPQHWLWNTSIPESSFPEVAELKEVYYLHITGTINTAILSSNVLYGVYFVYKLRVGHSGFINKTQTVTFEPEGETRDVNLHTQGNERSDTWMEIELGKYMSVDNDIRLKMILMETDDYVAKKGLLIEGIEIRPKVIDEYIEDTF